MSRRRPVVGDAFGRALLDCQRLDETRATTYAVIERNDGLVEVVDVADYFRPPDQWSPLDRWACEVLRGDVLDIGAGAGRHSLWLQSGGVHAIALDVSA